MSKFDTALDEAVYTIAGHGMADTMGTVEEDGWHAIADVSGVLLDNLGEHELADRVRDELGTLRDRQVVIRIREDDQGFVTRTGYALCGTPGEQTLWSQWDLDTMSEED